MGENTAIEWTDHTFNPWVGCTKISPACDHCYAESWANRTGGAALWQGERRRTASANWNGPLRWNRDAERAGARRRVFCASLADVFDNQVPEEWRRDLWDLIRVTTHLDWQLLTKRPQNVGRMLPPDWGDGWANVWLGTTVANQHEADRNVPALLDVPARIRFLSCEPILGAIDVSAWLPHDDCGGCDDGEGWGTHCSRRDIPRSEQCPRNFAVYRLYEGPPDQEGIPSWFRDVKQTISWVIVGGESGPGARPAHPDWIRALRDQCLQSSVPFFFKQWGEFDVSFDRDRDDPDWRCCDRQNAAPGRWLNLEGGHGFHGERVHYARRVGKKLAGALLDGVEHRKFPA